MTVLNDVKFVVFPAVILLEGGSDLDLTILDKPLDEPAERPVQNSESVVMNENE